MLRKQVLNYARQELYQWAHLLSPDVSTQSWLVDVLLIKISQSSPFRLGWWLNGYSLRRTFAGSLASTQKPGALVNSRLGGRCAVTDQVPSVGGQPNPCAPDSQWETLSQKRRWGATEEELRHWPLACPSWCMCMRGLGHQAWYLSWIPGTHMVRKK